MAPAERPDLLLIDDEEYPAGPEGEDSLVALGACAARWLLEPPKLAVPLLSAHAKAAGLAVEAIFRPRLPWKREKFREMLRRRPLAAGITTVAMFDPAQLASITSEIRAVSPATVIILGGHGAENSREIREQCDLYISGHGEGVLPGAVRALREGASPADIPGAVKNAEGLPVLAGSLRYEGIAASEYPDWSATGTAARRYPVEASRGCRFNCSFCGFAGKGGQVFRPAEEVVGEMLYDRRTRGVRRFEFVDSSLTSDPSYVLDLCARIRRSGLKPDWKCFARPDAFAGTPELAGEMAAAGCSKVFMGVESVHDHILSAMRRGMSRAVVEKGLDRAFAAGIKVHGNFIIGFPGETAETVDETVRFVSRRPFSSVYLCTFGASAEMLALAGRDPSRYARLSGRPVKGWTHDGMDYAEAYRLTLRAVRRINLAKLRPVAFSPRTNDPAFPPF